MAGVRQDPRSFGGLHYEVSAEVLQKLLSHVKIHNIDGCVAVYVEGQMVVISFRDSLKAVPRLSPGQFHLKLEAIHLGQHLYHCRSCTGGQYSAYDGFGPPEEFPWFADFWDQDFWQGLIAESSAWRTPSST